MVQRPQVTLGLFQFGEITMDIEKIIELLNKLNTVIEAEAAFIQPRSASHPREWSQREMEQFASLRKQRNDIVAEVEQLESLLS
jgi:hypothetical protein